LNLIRIMPAEGRGVARSKSPFPLRPFSGT
jgi:hypothetical protein